MGAKRVCAGARGPVASVLRAGLNRTELGIDRVGHAVEEAIGAEAAALEKRMVWLSTVAGAAPLIGFLGTLFGLIHAFDAVAKAGSVSPRIVAAGLSEALIPPAAGLVIAIPVYLLHNAFASRIERLVADLQTRSSQFLDALIRSGSGRGADGTPKSGV